MVMLRAEGSPPHCKNAEMALVSARLRLRQHQRQRMHSGHHHHARWLGMSVCLSCPCTTAAVKVHHSSQQTCSELPGDGPLFDPH